MPKVVKKRRRAKTPEKPPSRRHRRHPVAKKASKEVQAKPRVSGLSPDDKAVIQRAYQTGAPYFHPVYKHFRIRNTPLQGAHDTIKAWYAPHYRVPSHEGVAENKNGLQRGVKVDRELTYWARTGLVPSNVHEYTRKLMSAFKEMNWRPVHGQYAVGSLAWRKGTAVDLVMVDRADDSRWILVEVKTGMDNYFDKPCGMFLPPLEHISCTARHLAMLQLVLTTLLFEATSAHPIHDTQYVARVYKGGAQLYPLPKWCSLAREDMFRKLNANL